MPLKITNYRSSRHIYTVHEFAAVSIKLVTHYRFFDLPAGVIVTASTALSPNELRLRYHNGSWCNERVGVECVGIGCVGIECVGIECVAIELVRINSISLDGFAIDGTGIDGISIDG